LLFKTEKGTHIRVIDDDHVIPINHIYKCLKYIKLDKKSIWSIGEKHFKKPSYNNKILYSDELNNRGFSSKAQNVESSIALAAGASIYPRAIFDNEIFYIEKYPFEVTWLEYGARLRMLGYNIRIMPDIFVNHYYIENKRSYNSFKLNLETKFFVIFFHNIIYKKNIKNIALGTYEILKQIIYYNTKDLCLILRSSWRFFFFLKNKNFWKKKL